MQKLGRKPDSGSDLHSAVRVGNLDAVRSIFSSNPLDINSRDKHSRTPLHLASWCGHAEIVSYLCKHKADVGAAAMDDMATIHFASQKGHVEIVQTLLSNGASIRALTRKGMTALHYASQGSHLALVNYLLKKGASPNAKTKAGKTPLDLACHDEVRSSLLRFLDGSEKKGCDEKGSLETPHEVPEEEGDAVMGKRRVDDASYLQPKKAKVALEHLISSDDTQGEECL